MEVLIMWNKKRKRELRTALVISVFLFVVSSWVCESVAYGQYGGGSGTVEVPVADLNNDGIFNFIDLGIFTEDWMWEAPWTTETSYGFTGSGMESDLSMVEFSVRITLADAIYVVLDSNSLKNENMKNTLINKIEAVLEMIDEELYEEALDKLENDILVKMNGCTETGEPDRNDWITSCEEQSELYPLIVDAIEQVRSLMEPPGPGCPGYWDGTYCYPDWCENEDMDC
jgi:hypothetical protein